MEWYVALLLGLFGAAASIGLDMYRHKRWPNPAEAIGHLIIGGFVGYAWWALGLPNHFNTLMAGFMADTVIQALQERWGFTGPEGE